MPAIVSWARGLPRASRRLSAREVSAAVDAALAHGGRAGRAIAVVFVDDATLARMHGEWLGDDAPTDVLSFELGEDQPGPAGELYVSCECAERVARARGIDARSELLLYVVHGTLHLCGYDDRERAERRRMRLAEARVLARLAPEVRRRPTRSRARRAGR